MIHDITHKRFKVFKSSAGSGKTYTLVKEYLKIVLIYPEKLSSILAITFTNDAATEMKTRIIKELIGILSIGDFPENIKSKELLKQIGEELEQEFEQPVSTEVLVGNASKALNTILHRYSDFAISTIDSFVHGIVRTFAHDLRAPAKFDTELDSDNVIAKAVDLLISRLKPADPVSVAITMYIINQFDQKLSTNIEKGLTQLAKTLTEENALPFLNSLRNYKVSDVNELQQKVRDTILEMEQNVVKEAQMALELIHSQGLDQDSFYQKKSGIYGYFKNLASGEVSEKIIPGSNVMKTIQNGQWYPATLSKAGKDAVDGISGKLMETYFRIHGSAFEKTELYRLLQVVSRHLLPVGLLGEIHSILDELKAFENKLFIADFTRLIAESIAGEPAPYIFERLGSRFDHFMIDEFQDTSVLQWHNILPLIDNGLANAKHSLIVGDAKQAIYRWRNGDVEQFANLPYISQAKDNPVLQSFQDSLVRNYQENFLKVNFRTRKHIVEFNNGFFASCNAFLQEPLKKIYQNPAQNLRSDATLGYVEVSFLADTEDNENPKEIAMAEKVLETVNRSTGAGHAYSDIAILCRSKANGSFLARHLLEAGIPVVSPESLLLKQSPGVIFILALLKLLNNCNDDIAAAECLHYVAQYIATENNLSIAKYIVEAKEASGQKHLSEIDWCLAFDNLIAKLGYSFQLDKLRQSNPYDIVQHIVHSFFTSDSPCPFVLYFLDAVYDFSQEQVPSLQLFLQWWESQAPKASIALPRGIDAVQISTIHKSKGLEYPVVIHPFFSLENSKPEKKQHWINPDIDAVPGLPPVLIQLSQKSLGGTPLECLLEVESNFSMLDKINLAYVAFTRAKEKLFVISSQPNPDKISDPSSANALWQFVNSFEGVSKEGLCFSYGSFVYAAEAPVSATKIAPMQIHKLYANRPDWSVHARLGNVSQQSVSDATRLRGQMMHRVMEQIQYATDIFPVVDKMAAGGELHTTDADALKKNLDSLMQNDLIRECFQPGIQIKREAGMIDAQGNYLRPDRVAIFPEKTVVMDFKTGNPLPHYHEQLQLYANLLAEMGYPGVVKMLVYLDSGLVEVL